MDQACSDWRDVLFGRDLGVVEELPDGGYRAPLEQLDAGERYEVTSRDDGPANPPTPSDLRARHRGQRVLHGNAEGEQRDESETR